MATDTANKYEKYENDQWTLDLGTLASTFKLSAGNGGDPVCDARPEREDAGSRAAADLRHGVGHEACRRLALGQHEFYPYRLASPDQLQNIVTWYAECKAHPIGVHGLRNARGCAFLPFAGHCRTLFPGRSGFPLVGS